MHCHPAAHALLSCPCARSCSALTTPLISSLARRIPPPAGDPAAPLRALLFDAHHDDYRGVVTLVAVVDGRLAAGDRLASAATGQEYEALEVRPKGGAALG